MSINMLRTATNNFSESNIIGRGGFGVVYRGELEDGTQIAVKRMEAAVVSNKGLSEFQSEITVLTKVKHRHLVGLLGYCADGSERLLVYEFMPQGTLSQHLFEYRELQEKPLTWMMRLTIALDVARGLDYLHNLAHRSFIHRDLKPSNILLTDDFRAKVSDFGLVKLAPEASTLWRPGLQAHSDTWPPNTQVSSYHIARVSSHSYPHHTWPTILQSISCLILTPL